MAKTLFTRKASLIVAFPLEENFNSISAQVLEITDLRVSFRVVKTLSKDPNTAEIRVYNLSEHTRSAMPGQAAKVVLQAGYDEIDTQVFIGDARLIEHRREGADWVTKLQCGDGSRAYAFARVNESFRQGTQVADVIDTIGQKIGIEFGNVTKQLRGIRGKQFVNGYVAYGKASEALDKAIKAAGFDWSIQDGKLQLLTPGEANEEEVVVLSASSGLIGSPETGTAQKKKGKTVIKARSLLQGGLNPGGRVEIESRQHNGLFRILRSEFHGDTAGQDWYTSIEAEAL